MPEPATSDDSTQPEQPSAVGRIRAMVRAAVASVVRQRHLVVISITAVALLAGAFAGVRLWRHHQRASHPRVVLYRAIAALRRGDYGVAAELSRSIHSIDDLTPDEWGTPAFVSGAAAAYQAENLWGRGRERRYLLAARYLEEARDRGFPEEFRAEGLYLLGKSQFESAQYPGARLAFEAALPLSETRQTEIHRMLALANLYDSVPHLEAALRHSQQYLDDRTLPPVSRHEGYLIQSRIQLRLGRLAAGRESLDAIGANSPQRFQAGVVRARFLMHEAAAIGSEATTDQQSNAARRLYVRAIETLRSAQSVDTLPRVRYLLGVCLREIGDEGAAIAQFRETGNLHFETPEGVAATIAEADLLSRSGEIETAMTSFRTALAAIGRPENYHNPWLPLDTLRRILLAAHDHLLQAGQFDAAVQLARVMYPVLSRVQTLQLEAETEHAWGEQSIAAAGSAAPLPANALKKQARAHFRAAAGHYDLLARHHVTVRRYTDFLWEAALNHLAGHSYTAALSHLQIYLENETWRRRPQALAALGEALAAKGRYDEAIEALLECIERYPQDAAVYGARLVMARCHMEQGDDTAAERVLLENLNDDVLLTPQSKEWRDSLFALGRLLHRNGRYAEAARRLSEATVRYPQDERSIEANFRIGDSYSQRAAGTQQNISDTDAGVPELLRMALTRYEMVDETLQHRSNTAGLTPQESTLWRNSLFGRATALYDLGSYDRAIKAYETLAHEFDTGPQTLDAFVQLAMCYRRLNKPNEARATVLQARVVLDRLDNDVNFLETSNHSRASWNEYLDWMLTL